jgi:putative N6-adenine-specific DNA methylase
VLENSKEYRITVTMSTGLESVTRRELEGLGYRDPVTENGRILFSGNERDIALCNTRLRTADRVFIELASFRATDFDQLYEHVRFISFENSIPENGAIPVRGRSVKSRLHSVPACQSVVKKAVLDALRRKYRRERFPEDGPLFPLEIVIEKDNARLLLDTTGEGLHRRGYRKETGQAPIRENLAATLVLLSRWDEKSPLVDPMCGSGTIAIEAALMSSGKSPGIDRTFLMETWPFSEPSLWQKVRSEAEGDVRKSEPAIIASDESSESLEMAKRNAMRAGCAELIQFCRAKATPEILPLEKGKIITNPPYGERMKSESRKALEALKTIWENRPDWSLYFITPDKSAEKIMGVSASKKRKLYNGGMQTYLHSYFGS